MFLQSKFSSRVFVQVGLLLLVTGSLLFVAQQFLFKSDISPLPIFVFFSFFGFFWIWLVFGELRTKIIKVEIEGNQISVANYLGLGPKKIFNLSQFDGLQTAILPSKYDTYEYLYLIKDNKKVIKLSQFYHSNYAELKSALTRKVHFLGEQPYNLLQEIKEIFI